MGYCHINHRIEYGYTSKYNNQESCTWVLYKHDWDIWIVFDYINDMYYYNFGNILSFRVSNSIHTT